jgi:uncharacterized protein (DUF362 family)
MSEESDFNNTEVVIVKADTPKNTVLKGIETLGGISKIIKDGDQVFIKFNLSLPPSFPTNTNFDVLETLISACKKAGASKIFLGSFTFKSIPLTSISNMLNLEEYFNNLGAEFVCLDNSNLLQKKLKKEQIERLQKESFSRVSINEKEFFIPKVISTSDKLIVVNQVNVNPLFKLNLSILNSYSMVAPKYQEIDGNLNQNRDYITRDQYKKDLISNILDVFTIKPPDLVVNDIFYLLESAGPFYYKDSQLKKPSIMILGNNAISTDLITLKLLNIETQDHDLILEAFQRGLGLIDLKSINILGETLEENTISIELCKYLEELSLKNFIINSGEKCAGCIKQSYHFLNFIKTYMVKDLKYNPRNAFLVGYNPREPQRFDNVLLFGDCAIKSTKDANFRLKPKTSNKKKKSKKVGQKGIQKKENVKFKTNKNILELPGCPPDIFNCLELIFNYYRKKQLPNLSLLRNLLKILTDGKNNQKLRKMGVI